MAQLLGLSAEQVAGIRPLFPKERGVRGWMTGRCCAASSLSFRRDCAGWMPRPVYGPHKTLYNRCRRWWDKGVLS